MNPYEDDGALDGIPARTLEQAEQAERERLEAIAREAGVREAGDRQPQAGCPVELIPVGKKHGTVYKSLTAAALAIGIGTTNLSNQIKKNPTLGGYRWKKLRENV